MPTEADTCRTHITPAVPQSLANIIVHVVFSTKQRRPLIRDEERGQLHAYIAASILRKEERIAEIMGNIKKLLANQA